jgi:hypothetical protein
VSFGDLYTVPRGTQDPDLPQIDLPQVDAPPRRPRASLTVTPDPRPPDPFANVPEWQPTSPKGATAKDGDPFANVPEWKPSKPPSAKEGGRDIGPGEAGLMGVRESATFGAYPAVHGALSAGKTPEERSESEEDYIRRVIRNPVGTLGNEIGSLVHGLAKLGKENLIGPLLGLKDEGAATKVYNEEREAARKEQESAKQQNPGAYLTGQLAGGIATPVPGAGSAAGLRGGAALVRALKAGGIGGGLYGGGTALSEGEEPLAIARDTAIGGGVGLATGGLVHGAIEAGGAALGRGRDLVQGMFNPRALAERKVGEAMRTAQRTGGLGLQPHEYAQALSEGMPVHNLDLGGDPTRHLGRAAANLSPEARQIIAGPLAERDENRTQRFADRVYQLMGGTLDRGADKAALEDAGRAANGPRYRRAYAKGDFPIGTDPEMQTLMGSPVIQEAMKKAIVNGKDRAIRERQGAFNPGVSVTPDGRIVFTKGPSGVPTYPNIQYWDYVQRELRDMAEKAGRKSPSRGSLIEGLRQDLNKALDDHVPEFNEARAGAARFFSARDASEAGENFAKGKAEFRDMRDARRAIASMSDPERELFARSFMDTITEALKDKPDFGTIKKLFTSPRAMEKIEAAIGPARARELEVSLRAETMAQRTKEVIAGNSTTFQQWMDAQGIRTLAHGAGHAGIGVGGLAAFEALKEGNVDPKHLAAAALVYGTYKTGARHIDATYMRHLAETLMSDNPEIANRAVRAISRSPALFKALRAGTEAGTRIGAHEAGLPGLTTGLGAIYDEVMKEKPHEDHSQDQSVIEQPP